VYDVGIMYVVNANVLLMWDFWDLELGYNCDRW